ncbi:ABC-type nitrate/sulfonate/bicarbonate transport system substrate-binding protein [Gibbsiella quercinecans]|uniref:Putative aliphatic sulfonates-binding protein n=1 Tax=Gibbsiella quercinecans TaxID=929813 RepID=A0A250B6D0_9GAMM|nr:ABC transporter substrate-binding protein [Gibbsiella quercinecans]ATA21671.1 nitrate ABC transporter substrate-binding protein [Gibbsiella quercinecans]RLM03085.1 nitrate ABC transporter substrate-binding protein [Gibbsiella quercinecans]RLM04185.1 nitrate ABC transporter substrate-binding protein [Gibbsiella quercinecans]TCT88924.1 ABC-type nitrate/sulfonate/bicarbonate transport system substrate-binding protein [Gibbsiella quercinecans]
MAQFSVLLRAVGLSATLLTASLAQGAIGDAKLVLGDQARGLRSLVEAAGVMKDAPYQYQWANFQGAAPLFEAQRADAVDTSYAGDLPVLMAAAGGVDFKLIQTNVGYGQSNGIIVPKDSPLHSVQQLKGQTVVVSSARGSISQNLLYAALQEAGLQREDVQIQFVMPTDASAAFSTGKVAAWAVFDPYLGVAEQSGARLLRDGQGLTPSLGFLTATTRSLADPDKRAAIKDFAERVAKARQWAIDHPAEYAKVYAQLTRLPLETARHIADRTSKGAHSVNQQDINVLQPVADLFYQLKILPNHVDVSQLIDQEFTPVK